MSEPARSTDVVSDELKPERARELAMRVACSAFEFMPNYSWGEQTTEEVHGAIQTAAYKTLIEASDVLARISRAPIEAGWKLVPVEPTDDMAEAGLDELLAHLGPLAAIIRDPVYCWRAMIKAAPIASTGEPGQKMPTLAAPARPLPQGEAGPAEHEAKTPKKPNNASA